MHFALRQTHVLKANPYRDESGRFSSKEGAASTSYSTGVEPGRFSKLPVTKKVIADNRYEYSASDKLTLGGKKVDYDINVGKLTVSASSGEWRGMEISVNESHRGKGLAFELMLRAVKDVGPIKTSGVFSPAGKLQMAGLVKRGYADALDGGDYLIHFKGSKDKVEKSELEEVWDEDPAVLRA